MQKLRCIGVLLNNCPIPLARCHQCWYADRKGKPTLVKIKTFNAIRNKQLPKSEVPKW